MTIVLYQFPIANLNEVERSLAKMQAKRKLGQALTYEELDWMDWAEIRLSPRNRKSKEYQPSGEITQ